MVNEVLRRRNRSGPGFAPSGVEKADGYAGAMHRLRSEAAGTGGELALIERIRRASSRRTTGRGEVRLGIGDDCAILRVRPGEEIVVTTDFSLEGRHFRRDWHSPQSVGHRVLARGLSDLAAMGARPVAAFLSLALPREAARDAGWVDGFLDGFLSLARRTGTPLAGGDTSEAPGDGGAGRYRAAGGSEAGSGVAAGWGSGRRQAVCDGKPGRSGCGVGGFRARWD